MMRYTFSVKAGMERGGRLDDRRHDRDGVMVVAGCRHDIGPRKVCGLGPVTGLGTVAWRDGR